MADKPLMPKWDDAPPSQVELSKSTVSWDELPPYPQQSDGGSLGSSAKEFGRGFARGTTQMPEVAGRATLEGSAIEPQTDKYARNIGEFAGATIPLMASEFIAAGGMPFLVAKYGLSAIQKAIASGGLTMAIFEAFKGAQQDKHPLDTVSSMAYGTAGGAALGAGGYGLGKTREFLNKDMATGLANVYARPPKRIAEKQLDEPVRDVGELILNEPKLTGFKGHRKNYDAAQRELDLQELAVEARLRDMKERATTPNVPEVNVPEGQRFLPYKPGETQIVEPRQVPTGKVDIPLGYGLKGERVVPGKVYTRQPGGATYDTFTPGGVPADYAGTTVPPTPIPSNLEKMTGGLREVSNQPYPKQGPVVDMQEVVAPLEQRINELKRARNSDPNRIKALEDARDNFLGSGERYVDLETANFVRRQKDDIVGKAHESLEAKIAPAIEADEILANSLRGKIAEQDPHLASLLGRQHNLLNIKRSLHPQAAGRGIGDSFGSLNKIARSAMENPASLGLATLLREHLTPSKVIAPASRQASRFGLSESNSEISNRARDLMAKLGLSDMENDVYRKGRRQWE